VMHFERWRVKHTMTHALARVFKLVTLNNSKRILVF